MAFRKIAFPFGGMISLTPHKFPPGFVLDAGFIGWGLFVQGPPWQWKNCWQIAKADNSPTTSKCGDAPGNCGFIQAILNSGGLCHWSEPFNSVHVSSQAPEFQKTFRRPRQDCEGCNTHPRAAFPDVLGRVQSRGGCDEECMCHQLPVDGRKQSPFHLHRCSRKTPPPLLAFVYLTLEAR